MTTPLRHRTRLIRPFVLAGALLVSTLAFDALAAGESMPNRVEVSPTLVTAGQPSAAALQALRKEGFEAVVYLAPPTAKGSLPKEATIVGGQGMVFANIPIDYERPTAADYAAMAGVLDGLSGRKVLVHCQANYRASAMVFLYRTIALKEDPATAYADVTRVWTPNDTWRAFIEARLREHGIAFEPR
jgi:protein tyrosine phosphatase (PTP) superfamily phosphohydrolase (DUF442 family)